MVLQNSFGGIVLIGDLHFLKSCVHQLLDFVCVDSHKAHGGLGALPQGILVVALFIEFLHVLPPSAGIVVFEDQLFSELLPNNLLAVPSHHVSEKSSVLAVGIFIPEAVGLGAGLARCGWVPD